MRKTILHILIGIVSLFTLTNCDVHEFPVDQHKLVPFLLHLDFDTEMSFHTEVPYTRNGDDGLTKAVLPRHDFRYLVKAYRTDNVVGENRIADTTFVFTKSDLSDLNYSLPLELKEGTYSLRVWCDYVDAGSTSDKYYITDSFDAITLASRDNHSGSNGYRDAFRGEVTTKVIDPAYYTGNALGSINNSATVQMSRPLGKFEFISTDVDVFLTRVVEALRSANELMNLPNQPTFEQMKQSIDLNDFDVYITYQIFLPAVFNHFTDTVATSWEKTSFKCKMEKLNDSEMLLGHDLVFVPETGTTLSISVDVYDKNGELMSASRPVDVPIFRSKWTTVRGEFLTSIAAGGITINPGYDGEDFNIEIK